MNKIFGSRSQLCVSEHSNRHLLIIQFKMMPVFMAMIAALFLGCGKNKEDFAPLPPDAPPAAKATEEMPNSTHPGVATKLDEATQALREKNYEKATVSLLQLDRQSAARPLTMEESRAYNRRMMELQSALAEAAAQGDPNAQRAAEMLRRNRQAR